MTSSASPSAIPAAEFYAQRTEKLRAGSSDSISRYWRCTQILVALAVVGCIAFYQAIVAKRLPLWSTVLVIPALAAVVQQRHRYYLQFAQCNSLLAYYEKSDARLTHQWQRLDPGESFLDADHFYSKDLDLFGVGSLYQLLCSARTQIGRQSLANWMKAPANIREIQARQEAISELRERRDLPEIIAGAGPEKAVDFRPEFLRSWAGPSSPSIPPWAPILAFLLPLLIIATPILYWVALVTVHGLWTCLVFLLCCEAVLAMAFRGQTRATFESLGSLSIELPLIRELLQIMEREQFASSKLRELAGKLRDRGSGASRTIGRLQKMIWFLKLREIDLLAYPLFCLLWGTQFAMGVERWRQRHGAAMLGWITALGEFEALLSVATYAYEHPDDRFPELVEQGPRFEAQGLGHPLLAESVRNNVQLDSTVRFLIVSGSNMSGKSTFLRAIGLNAVLAFLGAPVCVAALRLSPMTIGAAIRVQDSVVDGRSHFLAEMYRLRRMIETAEREPSLFLSDEIMGGTNSHDRRIATEWVIRALMRRDAIGAITTHDLALTEIAANGLPGANVHFADSGESGNLCFDYKLRPGVLTHSNALNIAHMLGIDSAAEQTPPQKSG
ncbi:MAG TPA: DNA mismatch repair protein MutS [Verrucomicrobiae bacterium]|nr:DNA mismatch repair protein MutS [Verrucomicrobiae bacterium]